MGIFGLLRRKFADRASTDRSSGAIPSGNAEASRPVSARPAPVERRAARKDAKTTSVILRPIVTEKSAASSAAGVTVAFVVQTPATKRTIRQALWQLYGSRPLTVNIVNTPDRMRRTRYGRTSALGHKKAYATFRAGTTIDVTKAPNAL